MKKNEINKIFVEYVKENLSPTKEERTFISSRYDELKEILKGRTFINGSYARFTSTTPVNDLDVFYVLSEEDYKRYKQLLLENKAFDIDDILNDLAKFLADKYPAKVRIKPQPHSVGIFFGSEDDFSIDVVPALPGENGLFWVPESAHLSIYNRRLLYESKRGNIKWIKSDPKGYIQDASWIDNLTNGNFRKSAKFIKKWRRGCKNISSNFPLKSFHSELIVNKTCKSDGSLSTLDYIDSFYEQIDQYLFKAKFPDKADSSRYVDEYINSLSENEKSLVLQFRDDAKKILEEIYQTDSEVGIKDLVEKLLFINNKNQYTIASTVTAAYSKPYHE